MPKTKRTDRIWLRLVQAYGSRVAESYGDEMPKPWLDAIDDLTDEQIAYGLRKVTRDTPIHPPTLGQFVNCCVDMPQPVSNKGPTIQEQLCVYASLMLRARLDPAQFALPWEYLYREWIDDEKPKHLQRQAECTGVVIPAVVGYDSFTFTAASMLCDKEGYQKAMRYFQPGPVPTQPLISKYASAPL